MKTLRLDIRVTQNERDAIRAKAVEAQCGVSEYVRRVAVDGKISPVPAINAEQWTRLAGLVSNLNQLTRLANSGRVQPQLVPILEATHKHVTAIRESLGGGK